MFEFIKAKKKLSGFIAFVVLIVVYFMFFAGSKTVPPTYMLGTVTKGTIITAVSGSGQVIASSQVEVKPKISGNVLSVNVKAGDVIRAGQVIAELDSENASKAVRDANLNLQTAQVAMQKLQKPADNVNITQAQDAVTSAQRSLDQAKKDNDQQSLTNAQDIESAYTDGYKDVSAAFLDVPDAITNLKRVQSSADFSGTDYMPYYGLIIGPDSKFFTKFKADYPLAYDIYNKIFADFKTTTRSSANDVKYKLISDTLEMAKSVAANLEDARNMLDAVIDHGYQQYVIAPVVDAIRPKIITSITALNSDISTMQSDLDTIDSTDQNAPITKQKKEDAVTLAEETLKEKQDALAKLLQPADDLDVQNQQLAIQQRENAVYDAESNYSDYSVVAPFSGTVAKVDVNVGDTASPSTAAVTMVTNDLLAQISLNEVDAANVKVGDKVTMTFDALADLTITGKLVEMDTLGTVTQGVVTYDAKIDFDTQDARVKPGMSVSTEIITDVKSDVLTVPNSAIKTDNNGATYVEVLDPSLVPASMTQSGSVSLVTVPLQKTVQIGASNDTDTEILTGLNEGDQIIQQIISGTASAAAQNSASGLRIPGLTGGGANRGGGFTRGG